MSPPSPASLIRPDLSLLDRIPTLSEVIEAPPAGPAGPLEAQIDAAVDAAVDSALRQWRAEIEPRLVQLVADAAEQAVRTALVRRSGAGSDRDPLGPGGAEIHAAPADGHPG